VEFSCAATASATTGDDAIGNGNGSVDEQQEPMADTIPSPTPLFALPRVLEAVQNVQGEETTGIFIKGVSEFRSCATSRLAPVISSGAINSHICPKSSGLSYLAVRKLLRLQYIGRWGVLEYCFPPKWFLLLFELMSRFGSRNLPAREKTTSSNPPPDILRTSRPHLYD